MANKSGKIGTEGETAVVKVLSRPEFWPSAERRRLKGGADQGDITGTPGVCWEIKAGRTAERASDAQIETWLNETETERVNAHADLGVLVVKRKGIGYANAHKWWAIMRGVEIGWPRSTWLTTTVTVRMYLEDACRVLKDWGY